MDGVLHDILYCYGMSNVGQPECIITKVIFADPATIVFWSDGTKTVVKYGETDIYDKEKGLAMTVYKKVTGNDSKEFHKGMKWWIKPEQESKNHATKIQKSRFIMSRLLILIRRLDK